MQSFSADPHQPAGTHPAPTSFVDEVCGTLARLVAYVGALAVLAAGGMELWGYLADAAAVDLSTAENPSKSAWSLASRSSRAFVVSQFDPHDKTETYEIFRHPQGGRRDVFHWADSDKRPIAELEIYRPGGELLDQAPAMAGIARRMDPSGTGDLETAGLIDSKFGPVTLLRPTGGGADSPRACLAFTRRLSESSVRLSGWSCQDDNLPARRAAISCMLNRLTLLGTGGDARMAEMFARAELRRADCATSATPALSADWLTGAGNPQLRGRL